MQDPPTTLAAALPPLADVKRRLRLLKQPATIFGEVNPLPRYRPLALVRVLALSQPTSRAKT
jgi:hypothetical protein